MLRVVSREEPDRLLRDVGLRLVELRDRRGWSREDFAERLGMSVRYVGRIERGRQNLTVHQLAWLANHLGVRVADLFAAPGIEAIRAGRPPKTHTPRRRAKP
ncbi:MAG: helix-turn-helix transcriptional regulator [Polyangiaceae bacterium]